MAMNNPVHPGQVPGQEALVDPGQVGEGDVPAGGFPGHAQPNSAPACSGQSEPCWAARVWLGKQTAGIPKVRGLDLA